ncbi:MAG: aromatic ring-hydroxylating dioxygenase subunit alpha [Bdellovibrionales bacterium]|nr:aromatic ring-hydroxylating dioxygenase subunit alpha [Bdellovibrionales bacterium]
MYSKNLWYLGALSSEVKIGQMVPKKLLGDPVVITRGKDGKVFALKNICPHRGIPFHYGRVVENQVECPYHGWKFRGDGTCTSIPSLTSTQKLDCTKIKVNSFPVVEDKGLIWIFFPENFKRLPDSIGHPPFLDRLVGNRPRFCLKRDFKCHIDHGVIGLMDPAHGPFVHKSWFWRSPESIHEKKKDFAPAAPMGFQMVRHKPSKNAKMYKFLGGQPTTEITFQFPGVRLEHIAIGKRNIFGMTCLTPIDENNTQIYHLMFWDWAWLTLLKPVVHWLGRIFLDQDKVAIERQQEGLIYNPTLMLIDDADTQAKWYFRIKSEFENSQKEGREFQNPVAPKTLEWRS